MLRGGAQYDGWQDIEGHRIYSGVEDDRLTYAIIGAAQTVHTKLGLGYNESVYHIALTRELIHRQIPFESQKSFEVFYEGFRCGTFIADLLVGGQVIVELKAVATIIDDHRMQLVSYLRASGLSRGLLLNFGSRSLQMRRIINATPTIL